MTDEHVRHQPARLSTGLAIGATGIAGMMGFGGASGLFVLSPLGALVLAGGLWRRSRRTLVVGSILLISGIFAAGLAGAAPVRLVVAFAATLVAWDLAEYGIGVGEQLGRDAETWRIELFHAGASIFVATAAIGTVFGIFVMAEGGQPVATLLFLLVGITALLAALRSS